MGSLSGNGGGLRLGARVAVLAAGVGVPVAACSSDSASVDGNQGGFSGSGDSGTSGGIGGTGAFGGSSGFGGSGQDAGPCSNCPANFRCRYDSCVPDLGSCASNDDCPGDSYCDANGECIPYGIPQGKINDSDCQREIVPDGVKPTVQCEWEGPAPGDPTADSTLVYSSPSVADLNLDGDPNRLQPSIVLTTFTGANGRTGTLRIFDGRTCEEQLRIGGDDDPNRDDRPGYGTSWAIADLDGDVPSGGHPEIVGLHRIEQSPPANSDPLTLIAFQIDISSGNPSISRRWYGRDCATGTPVQFGENTFNFGPGVWDLDDDGKPEIVLDEMVFDQDGCLLTPAPASVTDYLRLGLLVTVADVDLDGSPELVRHDRIARWDLASRSWVNETWFANDVGQRPGQVAVADLGQYSSIPGKLTPNNLPEVVVVSAASNTFDPDSTGTIRVQALDGSTVWGPIALYSDSGVAGGHGGPPTAADFDGDGQVEFAAAANQYYVVYDPDCQASLGGVSPTERPGGKCARDPAMAALPDGILWAQLSQDFSSSSTGSSVFDFDGDGSAEAVYRDECYLRVYEGATGKVIFSAPAASGTGFELPVIADVDGDFATEILVARAGHSGCAATDPLVPSSTTPFESRTGFVVLRDPEDRWASSRPIWNQHAYSVTHVADDATIPRASMVAPNWLQPGLNNFRQNSQGDLGVLNIADLTVVFTDVGGLCEGQSGETELKARVCNRGTNPVQDGALIQFVESSDVDAGFLDGSVPGGMLLCEARTSRLLAPGECEELSCTGSVSGGNVLVIVDPDGTIPDCHPGNNDGAGAFALCPR